MEPPVVVDQHNTIFTNVRWAVKNPRDVADAIYAYVIAKFNEWSQEGHWLHRFSQPGGYFYEMLKPTEAELARNRHTLAGILQEAFSDEPKELPIDRPGPLPKGVRQTFRDLFEPGALALAYGDRFSAWQLALMTPRQEAGIKDTSLSHLSRGDVMVIQGMIGGAGQLALYGLQEGLLNAFPMARLTLWPMTFLGQWGVLRYARDPQMIARLGQEQTVQHALRLGREAFDGATEKIAHWVVRPFAHLAVGGVHIYEKFVGRQSLVTRALGIEHQQPAQGVPTRQEILDALQVAIPGDVARGLRPGRKLTTSLQAGLKMSMQGAAKVYGDVLLWRGLSLGGVSPVARVALAGARFARRGGGKREVPELALQMAAAFVDGLTGLPGAGVLVYWGGRAVVYVGQKVVSRREVQRRAQPDYEPDHEVHAAPGAMGLIDAVSGWGQGIWAGAKKTFDFGSLGDITL